MPWSEDIAVSELTRLVLCWKIRRLDGVVLGFTAHDRDIFIDGQRYRSAPSFAPSALVRSAGTSIDSMDLRGAVSHAAISESDLLAGKYDLAQLLLFLVDWSAPEAGQIDLGSGRFGRVSSDGHSFNVEIRGVTEALDRPIVELTSPECRAAFGDRRCGVSRRRFSRISQVSALIDAQAFEAEGLSSYPQAYGYGRLRWLSGDNSGSDSEIAQGDLLAEPAFNMARLKLMLREPTRRPVALGDRLLVEFGCDKRYVTCLGRFANQLNFRGEPFVPGIDALLRYPDA